VPGHLHGNPLWDACPDKVADCRAPEIVADHSRTASFSARSLPRPAKAFIGFPSRWKTCGQMMPFSRWTASVWPSVLRARPAVRRSSGRFAFAVLGGARIKTHRPSREVHLSPLKRKHLRIDAPPVMKGHVTTGRTGARQVRAQRLELVSSKTRFGVVFLQRPDHRRCVTVQLRCRANRLASVRPIPG